MRDEKVAYLGLLQLFYPRIMFSTPPTLPLFILLHGTCFNGAQWRVYEELLADVVEVYAPDLPGHGARAKKPFSMAAARRVVHEAVRAAGNRPVILGGHSLGGFVAMNYATLHHRHLSGLALMGSATEPRCRASVTFRMVARIWEAMGAERVRRMHEQTLGRHADARVWSAITEQGEQFGAVRAAWWQVMAQSGSWQLRRVSCPTLVLGGRQDVLHLQAGRFAAAAPRGKAVTVPWRGHLWPLTHPEEVAAHLRRFIVQECMGIASSPT